MKKLKISIAFALFILGHVFQTTHLAAQNRNAPDYNNNRIAVTADGNWQRDPGSPNKFNRSDPDDWGATPASLAMIAKRALQGKLVHYSYNNFIDAPPHTTVKNWMREGVEGAIQYWGFDESLFFDVPETSSTAIAHLANELGKSTASDPLFMLLMGPPELFYRAVKQAVDNGKINALAHVHAISHSGYNETHKNRNNHHTFSEAVALSGGRITLTRIINQNGTCFRDNWPITWCYDNPSPWFWMRDHPDPSIQWLFTRVKSFPFGNKADISDAGLVYYLLENDENGTPTKFKNLIGDGITVGDGGGDSDMPFVTMQKGNTNFAIDGGNGGANHRNVYLWNYNANTPNQQWEELSKGNGYYAYKKRGTNFCLDGGRGGQSGQNVILYTCGPKNQNQHWKKVSLGEGKYRLEKRNAPGFSIDGGKNGANRQEIKLSPSSNTDVDQQWLFNSANNVRLNAITTPQADSQAWVYPNPLIGDELTLDLGGLKETATIKVFDKQGKLVYTTKSQPGLLKIKTSKLNGQGMYYITMTEGNHPPAFAKFIVKN